MSVHRRHWTGGLPRYLREIKDEMEGYARGFGLDFFNTYFEVVNYDEMNEIASYGGFPTRYPHWRFGMDYERLQKSNIYGLSRIYELVINNDPCIAYLLEGNSLVDQKLVMAHVFAHCDFFKNNAWFSHTNRHMIDEMANHGSRIRGYIDRFGIEKVEQFVDVCLSIDNLIDIQNPPLQKPESQKEEVKEETLGPGDVPRIKAKSYMENFVNPPEFLEQQKKTMQAEQAKSIRFPSEPTRDVMAFLMEHAPLKPFERNIMEILREEAYYFAPQGQTKIMNEGWATYWHSKIMTEKALTANEVIDYADRTSGVTASSSMHLNPYKIGVELFRNIEQRWNKGQFGKEWEECDDMAQKLSWNRESGIGIEKIFLVRKVYNDITFIDEFLTFDFAKEQKLFSFGYNQRHRRYEIESREFREIKNKLLEQVTNMGQPVIFVVDANHNNRGELLLKHEHRGVDLDPNYSKEVLSNLYKIWKRPVAIETKALEKPILATFDGKEFKENQI